ncbi:hypothetical protein [Kordia zhangzhouensis]|uniref:hypothetical protein n=1 Tax=Kordia zhangzhouensis TaxID=1620405 RepID=UPI0006293F89|nr:hypothetical protein [Kordia zhangzhouensis]
MSSYNDNLHSSVVSSLNTQELELQNVEAKLEASMFSLYYAQGARITTAEELEVTTAKYVFQKNIHEQAIVDSDVSTNVLQSTKNAKSFTSKSVSNTSVAAANVQIAANAILKLASDTGSIFSIINAADFDTEIYAQSNKAYVLMNDTAYAAEQASQHSMEASALIAEVTTDDLNSKATVTDTSIKDLLSVVTNQFDSTTALLSTQSAELASANSKEKKAEGQLEDLSVAYNSANDAYTINNNELNLNLMVTTPINIGTHESYTVSFEPYKSPFNLKSPDENTQLPTGYPVQNYYVLLVEDSKSATFSINDAEGIVTEGYTDRFVSIAPSDDPIIAQKIYIKGVSTDDHKVLQDSEGKLLELGKDYVIFVFAVFTNGYKKSINTFEDFLTAPSKRFSLQNQLSMADSSGIQLPNDKNVINFGVFENPDYKVQYRCAFLPNNKELVLGLLTTEELQYIDQEVNDRKQIENLYTEKISEIKAKLALLDAETKAKKTEQTPAKDPKGTAAKKASKPNSNTITDAQRKELLNEQLQILEKEQAALASNEGHLQPGFFFNLTIAEQIPAGSYTTAQEGTDSLIAYLLRNIEDIQESLKDEKVQKLNTTLTGLASKKSAKNDTEQFLQDAITYIEDTIKEVVGKTLNSLLKDYGQLIKDLILLSKGYQFYSKTVTLAPETTDNFGNRLINNNEYIPAIISISNNPDETVNVQFINALSDFQHTAPFTYVDPYASKTKLTSYPKPTIN